MVDRVFLFFCVYLTCVFNLLFLLVDVFFFNFSLLLIAYYLLNCRSKQFMTIFFFPTLGATSKKEIVMGAGCCRGRRGGGVWCTTITLFSYSDSLMYA